MRMSPVISLSVPERHILSEGIRPWRLLEEFGAPEDVVCDVEKTANMCDAGASGWSTSQVDRAALALTHLAELLVRLSTSSADPNWVGQVEAAKAEGSILLIPDPESAVRLMIEVRKWQAEAAYDALLLLQNVQQRMAAIQKICSEMCDSEKDDEY